MTKKSSTAAHYFPFRAKDWRSSESVALMSLAERGAFIDLLAVAWLSSEEPCTIPAGDSEIAALLRVPVADWLPIAPRVLAEFDDTTPRGRLRTPKLWSEYRAMQEKHRKQVQGGRTTALKRWAPSGSLAIANQPLDSDSLASGSQSQSQSQSITTTPAKKTAEPTPDEKRVLDFYVEAHPRRRWGPDELRLVRKRLGDGIPADMLCLAITGNKNDRWHRERKKHELSYVLRNADMVSSFADKGQAFLDATASGQDFWDNRELHGVVGA
jgi:hypothetical protein